MKIHYCCPKGHAPNPEIAALFPDQVIAYNTPEEAVKHTHAVYTDVWTSMGFEEKNSEAAFSGFQVNEALMAHARPEAVFMHCMPMERGKEVSSFLPDSPCSIIFSQAKNRLHVQKAVLIYLGSH